MGGHQLEDLAALQRSTLAASLPQLVGNQAGGAAATPAPGKGVSRKTILLGMLPPLLFLAFSCFRPSFFSAPQLERLSLHSFFFASEFSF